jgi:ketosteroid isomerase-like protein
MSRTTALIILTMFLSLPALAQKSMPLNESRIERELMQLERDWSAAYLKHDTATIDRILAEDYVGTDGRGWMTNKAQEIEEAKEPAAGAPAPPFVVLDEKVTDMKVRSYGHVGVVTGRVIEKIKSKEKESTIQYRRTTVWVKRQGRWQCVSFHGSRILEPSGQ